MFEHRRPKLSVSMADKNIRICMGIPLTTEKLTNGSNRVRSGK